MRILFKLIVIACAFTVAYVNAESTTSRSGSTEIESIVIKHSFVQIYTVSGGACGKAENNEWRLVYPDDTSLTEKRKYEALLSGFLASKAAGKKVDISGKGYCSTTYDDIDWAYVLI